MEIGTLGVPGQLVIPSSAKGLVLFAHGSGSSHLSPRNRQVASTLNRAGIGTLLFDLLTEEESQNRANVFDISLLAERLKNATRWVQSRKDCQGFPLGYFGASTGAAAALWAAADLKEEVSAIVSRGGRPDLALHCLDRVTAPTLLIVGEEDAPVIEMNRDALPYLRNGHLTIIPGATHLFEETGTLEAVAQHARKWFVFHFQQSLERGAA